MYKLSASTSLLRLCFKETECSRAVRRKCSSTRESSSSFHFVITTTICNKVCYCCLITAWLVITAFACTLKVLEFENQNSTL